MQHYLFTSGRRFGKYIHAASGNESAAWIDEIESELRSLTHSPNGDTVSYEESDRT